jgi:hypothetical protein
MENYQDELKRLLGKLEHFIEHHDNDKLINEFYEVKEELIELKVRTEDMNQFATKNELEEKIKTIHERYAPVKAIVFALVGLILSSVFVALIALIIKK